MSLFYMMDVLSADELKFMYLFPTYTQMQDFLKSRIRNELNNSYYNSLLDNSNNSLTQLSFRKSTVMFRSGSKASITEGVDIAGLWYDEYERANKSAEASALESMKSDNRYGLVRRWSTPGSLDMGTDARYKQSDQREWKIKCEHCGYYQRLEFDKNIHIINEDLIDRVSKVAHPGATEYVCSKCGKNLESSRWYNGEWVAKYPNQNKPVGFLISQLDAVWITSDQIYTGYLNADSKQLFYNYTLGLPYENTALAMADEDILSNRREDLPNPIESGTGSGYPYITLGIDWGENFHHIVALGMRESGAWDVIGLHKVPRSKGVEDIEQDLRAVEKIIMNYDPTLVLVDTGLNVSSFVE